MNQEDGVMYETPVDPLDVPINLDSPPPLIPFDTNKEQQEEANDELIELSDDEDVQQTIELSDDEWWQQIEQLVLGFYFHHNCKSKHLSHYSSPFEHHKKKYFSLYVMLSYFDRLTFDIMNLFPNSFEINCFSYVVKHIQDLLYKIC